MNPGVRWCKDPACIRLPVGDEQPGSAGLVCSTKSIQKVCSSQNKHVCQPSLSARLYDFDPKLLPPPLLGLSLLLLSVCCLRRWGCSSAL
jgi:hypothetical protein